MRGRGCGGSALSDTTREYTREGAGFLRAELPAILAKSSDVLSPCMLRIVEDLAGKWRHLDEPIEGVSSEIAALVDQNAACKRLMIVPGIGPIISSAIASTSAPGGEKRKSESERGPGAAGACGFVGRGIVGGLLVIANAAAHIASPGYEAHFLKRGRVVRPRKHVADLPDSTIRFLRRSVEFRAIHFAIGVCKAPV